MLHLVMEEDCSSANHFRQKKALCVWSKVEILRFYFVGHFFFLNNFMAAIIMVQLQNHKDTHTKKSRTVISPTHSRSNKGKCQLLCSDVSLLKSVKTVFGEFFPFCRPTSIQLPLVLNEWHENTLLNFHLMELALCQLPVYSLFDFFLWSLHKILIFLSLQLLTSNWGNLYST